MRFGEALSGNALDSRFSRTEPSTNPGRLQGSVVCLCREIYGGGEAIVLHRSMLSDFKAFFPPSSDLNVLVFSVSFSFCRAIKSAMKMAQSETCDYHCDSCC